jgi:Carboxypeptidase regulatory-like domain
MATTNFNCALPDLADTVRLGFFEYEQYQDRFAAHKFSKYTPTFGAESNTMLQEFVAMEDFQAFSKRLETAREAYYGEVKSVAGLFKTLKSYINELSSDKTVINNYYKDAGQQLFNDLSANNLDQNDKLLSTMMRFVAANQTDLTAKDLPAAFAQQLKDKQAALKTTNKAWLDTKEAASAASEAKVSKGNDLKNRLADIFLDAQRIFQEEKDIAKKFVWDTILTKVRGVREAGVGGKVTLKGDKKGVAGITVSIVSLNLSVVTDEQGRYEHAPLPEGVYDLDIKGDGFKPLVIEKRVVKSGVIGRLNIELEAV